MFGNVYNNIKCGLNNIMKIYCCLFIVLTVFDVGILDDITIPPPNLDVSHSEERKPEERFERFEIHYSLKSIWDIINSPQYSGIPVVKKIKAMWDDRTPPRIIQKKPRKHRKNVTSTTTAEPGEMSSEKEEVAVTTQLYETTTRVRLPGRQNPFVLVEGTLTASRRKLLRGLMKHTTFAYVRTMRKCPFKFRDKFKGRELLKLRRAFVSLQLYLSGRDVEAILEERPVIMSGFWLRQAAEYIARRHRDLKDLPGVGSPCYQWPQDLVRPDLVLFLHTPRRNGTITEDTGKRLQRIVEVYHRMQPPVMVLDDSYNEITDKRVSELRKMMLDRLSQKYPHVNELLKYKKPSFHVGRNKTNARKKKREDKKHANVTMPDEPIKN